MVKRVLITAVLLLAAFCSALDFTYVEMENYGSAVSRIVIGLYGTGDYKVIEGNNYVEINLDNTNANKANIQYQPGGLVYAIEQIDNKMVIPISSSYLLEQMVLDSPRRLVLDIIVAKPDKQQKLELADFYTSAGKLNSADKIYYELAKSYPEDYAILYKWTLLLKQRGSSRINEIAAKIPQNSEYYPFAQQIIKGNQLRKAAQCTPAVKTQNACKIEGDKEKAETKSLSLIPKAPEKAEKTANPIKDKKLFATKWIPKLMLLIILILLLILIYHILANVGKRKKKPPLNFNLESQKKTELTTEENKTLVLMVRRLLDSGWKNSEIARELKISEEEVERLVQLCHQDES